ncbi:MAG: hypothetical protein A2W18_13700 [Candidatus Muproteobacteria bacterium RBG_16_60_9]|uniref:Signal peptidase n=1 Tax=Candidatus Muproteobacteria bacterium RBG_16_60_9 TaxID=1817755 RepID=A0A1F6UVS7_9PROT|nr:MAG: hypothetical protein A2W18_13700 [Candidatus Muproteobacteria bacterium RBG_16_60_9]
MKRSDATIAGAIAGLLTLVAGGSAYAANVHCVERERCFGVVKAGQNDCSTASSACSGTAKADFQKDAWVYLPKGTCGKLGGTLKTGGPGTAQK